MRQKQGIAILVGGKSTAGENETIWNAFVGWFWFFLRWMVIRLSQEQLSMQAATGKQKSRMAEWDNLIKCVSTLIEIFLSQL